jgi:hypothetical protein
MRTTFSFFDRSTYQNTKPRSKAKGVLCIDNASTMRGDKKPETSKPL